MSEGTVKRAVRKPLLSFSSFILAIVVGVISSFTFSAVYDMARAALSGEHKSVAGVWRGDWQGVPAVTLKLEQSGGQLSGTINFNRVVTTEDGPRVDGSTGELPLINPQFDGQRLSFELSSKDDVHPTIFAQMEMRLENEEQARLLIIRRAGAKETIGQPIRMERSRSF